MAAKLAATMSIICTSYRGDRIVGAGRKILISVDDPFHADMLSHIFGVEGFLVLTCGNDEVFFVARDERPDAVISVVGTLGASISDLAMQSGRTRAPSPVSCWAFTDIAMNRGDCGRSRLEPTRCSPNPAA